MAKIKLKPVICIGIVLVVIILQVLAFQYMKRTDWLFDRNTYTFSTYYFEIATLTRIGTLILPCVTGVRIAYILFSYVKVSLHVTSKKHASFVSNSIRFVLLAHTLCLLIIIMAFYTKLAVPWWIFNYTIAESLSPIVYGIGYFIFAYLYLPIRNKDVHIKVSTYLDE